MIETLDDGSVIISDDDGFQITLSGVLVSQLRANPPAENTLFGLPIVMEDSVDQAETGVVSNLQEYPQQCSHTKAAIALYGVTARGACPTIVSRRSRLCACGKLGANGKYRAAKNCCGKSA
jgi:hypothetical protein